MRTRISNLFAIAVLVCGAFWCSESRANVCFAANGDCGDSSTDFAESVKPDNGSDRCAEAGFTKTVLAGWATTPTSTGCGEAYVAEHCPYNPSYVKCCGAEFLYAHCDYPLMEVAQCGMLHSCICDSKFKFIPEQCRAERAVENTPCTQYFVQDNGSTVAGNGTIYYKNCACDRQQYKYCSKHISSGCKSVTCHGTGQVTDGTGCHSRGDDENWYYPSCHCNSTYYLTEEDCDDPNGAGTYGVYNNEKNSDTGHCKNLDYNGRKQYRTCCTCDPMDYPYSSHTLQPGAKTMSSCSADKCSKGQNMWRISECADGYELVARSNGQKECLPKTCELATKLWIANVGGAEYSLLKSDGKTYTYTGSGANVNKLQELGTSGTLKYVVLADNITISSSANSTSSWSRTYCKQYSCSGTQYTPSNGNTSDVKCSNCCYWVDNNGSGQEYPIFSTGKPFNPDKPVNPVDPHPSGTYNCYKSGNWNNGYYNANSYIRWECDPDIYSTFRPYCTSLKTESGTTYTYKGLGGLNTTQIYSGKHFGSTSSWYTRGLKHACASNPLITYSVSTGFPVSNDANNNTDAPTNYFYGVDITLTKTSKFNREIYMDGGKLEFTTLTVNKPLHMSEIVGGVKGSTLTAKAFVDMRAASSSLSEAMSPKLFEVTNCTFRNGLYSSGLNYKFKYLDFAMPSTQKLVGACLFASDASCKDLSGSSTSPKYATIILPASGYMECKSKDADTGISIYPVSTDKGAAYGSYVYITGASADANSRIKSNVYVGSYYGYADYTRYMGLMLGTGVKYDQYDSYIMSLSPGSRVGRDPNCSTCNSGIYHSDSSSLLKDCWAVKDVLYYRYPTSTCELFNGNCRVEWETLPPADGWFYTIQAVGTATSEFGSISTLPGERSHTCKFAGIEMCSSSTKGTKAGKNYIYDASGSPTIDYKIRCDGSGI